MQNNENHPNDPSLHSEEFPHDHNADMRTDDFGVQVDPSQQSEIYEHEDNVPEHDEYEPEVPPKKTSKLKPILFVGAFGVVGLGAMAALTGLFSSEPVSPRPAAFQQPQVQPAAQQPAPAPVDQNAEAEVDRIAALMEGRSVPSGSDDRASTSGQQVPRNASVAAPAERGKDGSGGTLSIESDAGSIEGMIQQMVGQMDDVAVRVAEIEKDNRETQAQVLATQQEVGRLKQAQSSTLQSLEKMQKQLDEILNGSSQSASHAPSKNEGNRTKRNVAVGGMHTVAKGESLSLIAAQYGISLDTLVQANGINNPSFIPVGLKIRVDGNEVSEADKARNARLTTGVIAASTRGSSSTAAQSSGPAWQVAGMSPGRVVLVSREGRYISGAVGENVPGVGRITAINMAAQTVSTTGGTLKFR